MKFTFMLVFGFVIPLCAIALTEVVDGVTWNYVVNDGKATLYHSHLEDYRDEKREVADACISTATAGVLSIPASLGGYPVTEIGMSAFIKCAEITEVKIPQSVLSVGYTAFSGCSKLTNIVIPNTVLSVGSLAFGSCTSLTNAVLPKDLATIPSYCFYMCTSLESVTWPENLRSIEEWAFTSTGLRELNFPDGLETIGQMAFCPLFEESSLVTVTFPASVRYIGEDAFYWCDKLLDVTLNSTNVALEGYAFYGCDSLSRVEVKHVISSLGQHCFEGCSNLVEVVLHEGLTYWGPYAFSNCPKIGRFVVPRTCTNVCANAFSGSDAIVYLASKKPGAINTLVDAGLTVKRTRLFPAAASWISAVGLADFNGFVYDFDESKFQYRGASFQESSPTTMDYKYKILSVSNKVEDVRVLAYADGVRDLSKLINVESFADGTQTNVGDRIGTMVERKISWAIPGDYAENVANLQMETLGKSGSLLQLELVEIPANGSNEAMEFSWNTYTADQVFNALLWLYASKTEGLTLENGALKYGGKTLASGTGLSDAAAAASYVLKTMGFDTMTDDDVAYIKAQTGMELQPSGVRQYGVRRGASIGAGANPIGFYK